MRYLFHSLVIAVFFNACTYQQEFDLKSISTADYSVSAFTSLPSWENEDFEEILLLFQETCRYSAKDKLFKRSCAEALHIPQHETSAIKLFFEENFTPFVSLSKQSLATGYFEPLFSGSLLQSEAYPCPVYGVPDDLIRNNSYPLRTRLEDEVIKPYFTRKQIAENALEAQKPICYLRNQIDLFFLQVQGSGRIRLEDGKLLYLGYADYNGYPYVSIGKEMIKKGLIAQEDISLESIRSYLIANPKQSEAILNLNPSYVFFKTRTYSASGSLGIILTKERSVAVDKAAIPLGMPLFISTQLPLEDEKYERVVFAHDTGSAIEGEARIDIFFGSDEMGAKQAGMMKEKFKLWMLVPNDYLRQSKQKIE